jgi:hypothetical protein
MGCIFQNHFKIAQVLIEVLFANKLFQTSQTGGQQCSNTFPFSNFYKSDPLIFRNPSRLFPHFLVA